MLVVVRGFVAVALLAGGLAWSVTATAVPTEQTVIPVEPPVEQRVDGIEAPVEQRVETLGAEQAEQAVNGTDPKTSGQRAASAVGKVALVVVATVVSIATMAASLLFF
jgi:hypothetical protein